MNRVLFISLVLVGWASSAYAQSSITLPIQEGQYAAIQTLIDGTTDADGKPVTMTVESYITQRCTEVMDNYVTQARAKETEQYKSVAEKASDAVREQIKNLLTCGKAVCE